VHGNIAKYNGVLLLMDGTKGALCVVLEVIG